MILDFDAIELTTGGHEKREDGMCAMEFAAWLAGEEHSDHPRCVSPVIGAFMRAWNDQIADDDQRQRLKLYAKLALGTAGDGPEADEQRAWMATDWLVRVHTPTWLGAAGLTVEANLLTALPEIVGVTTARAAAQPLSVAREAAWAAAREAAWAAAREAAWAAAREAAWEAAGEAAWAAAREAAWAAAGEAAWEAAGEAAWAAAGEAAWEAAGEAAWAAAREAAWAAAREAAWAAAGARLAPFVSDLRESAFDLLDHMIAVNRS